KKSQRVGKIAKNLSGPRGLLVKRHRLRGQAGTRPAPCHHGNGIPASLPPIFLTTICPTLCERLAPTPPALARRFWGRNCESRQRCQSRNRFRRLPFLCRLYSQNAR